MTEAKLSAKLTQNEYPIVNKMLEINGNPVKLYIFDWVETYVCINVWMHFHVWNAHRFIEKYLFAKQEYTFFVVLNKYSLRNLVSCSSVYFSFVTQNIGHIREITMWLRSGEVARIPWQNCCRILMSKLVTLLLRYIILKIK